MTPMSQIEETVPEALAAEAEAARLWLSRERNVEFKLTGIVDPEEVLRESSGGDGRELQLILCGTVDGQEACLRERFQLRPSDKGMGFDVSLLDDPEPAIGSPAPTLDPPVGVRASWLDGALAKHSFVVLVFYRGFW
jgi:hypothetical protein